MFNSVLYYFSSRSNIPISGVNNLNNSLPYCQHSSKSTTFLADFFNIVEIPWKLPITNGLNIFIFSLLNIASIHSKILWRRRFLLPFNNLSFFSLYRHATLLNFKRLHLLNWHLFRHLSFSFMNTLLKTGIVLNFASYVCSNLG